MTSIYTQHGLLLRITKIDGSSMQNTQISLMLRVRSVAHMHAPRHWNYTESEIDLTGRSTDGG